MKKWLCCILFLTLALTGCRQVDRQREIKPYDVAVFDGKEMVTLSLEGEPKVVERLEATDVSLSISSYFPVVKVGETRFAAASLKNGKNLTLPVSLSETLFVDPIVLDGHSLVNTYAISDTDLLFTESERGGKVTFYRYHHTGKKRDSVDFEEAYDYVAANKLTYADGRYYALMQLSQFNDPQKVKGAYQIWVLNKELEREEVIALEGQSYHDLLKVGSALYLIDFQSDGEVRDPRLMVYDLETKVLHQLPLDHPYPYALHLDAVANKLLIEHDQTLTDKGMPVWTVLDLETQEQHILPFLVANDDYTSHVATGNHQLYTLYGHTLYRYSYDEQMVTEVDLKALGLKQPQAIFVKE